MLAAVRPPPSMTLAWPSALAMVLVAASLAFLTFVRLSCWTTKNASKADLTSSGTVTSSVSELIFIRKSLSIPLIVFFTRRSMAFRRSDCFVYASIALRLAEMETRLWQGSGA